MLTNYLSEGSSSHHAELPLAGFGFIYINNIIIVKVAFKH